MSQKGRGKVKYADEFLTRYNDLTYGQKQLVDKSVVALCKADDPTIFAHHLERRSYYCNWSHRVRANLLVVFGVSKNTITFLSTGTHSQAYNPS